MKGEGCEIVWCGRGECLVLCLLSLVSRMGPRIDWVSEDAQCDCIEGECFQHCPLAGCL